MAMAMTRMSNNNYMNNFNGGGTGPMVMKRDPPGPYQSPSGRYDPARYMDTSYLDKRSGTRDPPQTQWGPRSGVYEKANQPGSCFRTSITHQPTSLAETVEAQMGKCVPCRQELAPTYGPPGEPNKFTSYPVRAPFENRVKWNQDFGTPFVAKNNGGAQVAMAPGPSPPPQQQRMQQPPPPSGQQPMQLGCNITSSGEDQYLHRFTYLNRFFNEQDGEIHVQQPKGMETKFYGQYTDQLFKTQADNSDNKVSTGVMVNPYTGEMFETFENAMPPPTKDKSLLAERFDVVNPKLVWAQGGINPHAPLPTKKEICKVLPGVDHGPNVWGDQLYADERRKRLTEIANRDIWNNRNGDYSTARGFAKEKPAGYTGLQPYYRPLPYLPPTQTLDNKGYVPVSSYTLPEASSVKSQVFITKADLTNAPVVLNAGPIDGVDSEYVVQDISLKPTWRGYSDTNYNGPANFAEGQQYSGPSNTEVRTTLKQQMETEFIVPVTDTTVVQDGGAGHVVISTENRSTLKEQMEQQFSKSGADSIPLSTGGSGYVVLSTQNKSTLKEYTENSFGYAAGESIPLESGGAVYAVIDRQNRSTLKEQMESTLPAGAVATIPDQTGGGEYVLGTAPNKSTLKEYMELTYPAGAVATISDQTGGGEYVLGSAPNKSTLKEYMELTYPAGAVSTIPAQTGGGEYVVVDPSTLRTTLRQQMETMFDPTGISTIDVETGGANYVVIDKNVKWTWKQEMEKEFPANPVEDGFLDGEGSYSGTWIPFQGPQIETKRQFQEYMPNVGRPAHDAYMDGANSGDTVGNGLVTSKQHRGVDETNYVTLSKVPADPNDTGTRWIGASQRDTKREMAEYTPMSDLSMYQTTAPRMIGAVSMLCNTDMHENDDEYNSMSHGFVYPVQQAIIG